MDQFSALGLQKPSFDMGHRSLTIWDIAASRSSSVQLSTASKNRASSARYRASTSRTSSSASQPRLAALCNSFSCTSGRKCTSIVWAPALILRQRHRKNRKPGQGAGGPFRVKHTLAVILTANQHKAPGPPALIQIIRCTPGTIRALTRIFVSRIIRTGGDAGKRSARTAWTASAIADSISSAGTPALTALVSATVWSKTRQRTYHSGVPLMTYLSSLRILVIALTVLDVAPV